MNTLFNISGRDVYLTDSAPVILEDLPAGTYGLRFSSKIGLYLEAIEPFEMPSKVYGDIDTRAERIKTTFKERKGVTGVLLNGEKGSGKTLLGKKVAIDLLKEEGQPIIVVNMPINGDEFGVFLQRIGKPVTLFFDEFEKVYKRENQEGLLTLLDGVYPFKSLAIMTSNSNSNMADALMNRPGRIFYKINYDGLDYVFAEEYTRDKLKNPKRVEEVMRLVTLCTINFDQLQALIEEMNRYDEGAVDSVQLLNIDITMSGGSASILNLVTPSGLEINIKDLKKDRIFFDYGNCGIFYKYPNTNGITWNEAVKDEESNFVSWWTSYLREWGVELREWMTDNSNEEKPHAWKDAALPFMMGYVDAALPENDDEEDDGEPKGSVKAAPGNCLSIVTADGHRIFVKRNKPVTRKNF